MTAVANCDLYCPMQWSVPGTANSSVVQDFPEDRISAKQRPRELRDFLSYLTDDPELKGCGRTIRKGRVGSATEILEVTTTCKRGWLCPTCGYTRSWQQANDLRDHLQTWRAGGGFVALLTLTQSHTINDRLDVLWDRIEQGWAAVKTGSGWTADRETYGVHGYVRITEVVHNPTSGWNVHLHVILLLESALDELTMQELRASIAGRFARRVARRGGHVSPDVGQDLRAVAAGTEGRLASYLFKGTTIYVSDDGSRTAQAILSDLESTGEGMELWNEFTAVVSGSRRLQVRSSNHLDRLCQSGPSTSLDK